MIVRSSIFWDITPCSPLQVNGHYIPEKRTLRVLCVQQDYQNGDIFSPSYVENRIQQCFNYDVMTYVTVMMHHE
jgi:hypothetical protein